MKAAAVLAVAVELLPITGQTLPLISSGGSSIWMSCIALGIIISVTKKDEEIEEEKSEKKKRKELLNRMLDEQIAKENALELNDDDEEFEDEENYSIVDKGNPMNAVLRK